MIDHDSRSRHELFMQRHKARKHSYRQEPNAADIKNEERPVVDKYYKRPGAKFALFFALVIIPIAVPIFVRASPFDTSCGDVPSAYYGLRAALIRAGQYKSDSPSDFAARRKFVDPQSGNATYIRKLDTTCPDDRRWIARLNLIENWYEYFDTDLIFEDFFAKPVCVNYVKAGRRLNIASNFKGLGLYSDIIAGSDADVKLFSDKLRYDAKKLGLTLPRYGASEDELQKLVDKYEREWEVAMAESPDCK